MNMKTVIFVFSFNRWKYLQNCLKSIDITNVLNLPVIVIDDNSNEPNTVKFLKEIGLSREVFNTIHNQQREYKTGGLCGGMNLAMSTSRTRGFDQAIFIQDDMQFVRCITSQDLDNFKNYFALNENSMQISICYFHSREHKRGQRQLVIAPSGVAWRRLPEYEIGKSWFSDVGVFNVERFFDRLGYFCVGEHVNSARCAESGLFRGMYRAPMMHWLPFPITYRGGRRKLLYFVLEKITGAGFHPYEILPDKPEYYNLKSWDDPLIFAESALSCPTVPRSVHWTGGDSVDQIITWGGWRRTLFNNAQRLRKSMRSLNMFIRVR